MDHSSSEDDNQYMSYKDMIRSRSNSLSSDSSSKSDSKLKTRAKENTHSKIDDKEMKEFQDLVYNNEESRDRYSDRLDRRSHSRSRSSLKQSRNYKRSRSRSRSPSYSDYDSYSSSRGSSRNSSRSRSRSSSYHSHRHHSTKKTHRDWEVPRNPLFAAHDTRYYYEHLHDKKRHRNRSNSPSWNHDAFIERAKSPSPERPKTNSPYIPEQPTWISKAGGVAIFTGKVTTSASSQKKNIYDDY
ncbi:hypothetical protein WA158_007073 [Blastocystis sp. Blastoise]